MRQGYLDIKRSVLPDSRIPLDPARINSTAHQCSHSRRQRTAALRDSVNIQRNGQSTNQFLLGTLLISDSCCRCGNRIILPQRRGTMRSLGGWGASHGPCDLLVAETCCYTDEVSITSTSDLSVYDRRDSFHRLQQAAESGRKRSAKVVPGKSVDSTCVQLKCTETK